MSHLAKHSKGSFPKGSFQRRFLMWVLPALVTAGIVVSLGFGMFNYLNTKRHILDQQSRSMPVVAVSLAEPLWGLRYDAVLTILQGLTADTDIVSATVQDDKGYVIATAGVVTPDAIALHFPIRYEKHQISEQAGTISVRVSMQRAWSEAATGLLTGLAAALASSLAVLIGVISVNHSLIVRPLSVLLRGIEQLKHGGERRRIPLTGASTEFDHVIATFNVMQDRLEADERERTEITSRLDLALSNMAQGLVLYSADYELLLVNARSLSLLEVPPGSIVAGMQLRKVVSILAGYAGQNEQQEEQRYQDLMEMAARKVALSFNYVTASGSVLNVSHETLADGGFIRTYEDITARCRNEEQIAYLARHDALSGLPNRSTFDERLQMALGLLGQGTPFTVLCLDLDRFKDVNDTFGHPVGDALLKSVSTRLTACVRRTDTVARLGGDEFAILQFGTNDPEDVTLLARRVIDALSSAHELDGHEVVIGVSIGVAVAPSDGTSAGALLKNADMALYRAKADGRGTFRFFEAHMDARLQLRRQLELDMRRAIRLDEFELFYQPLMSVRQLKVVGFEALIRWRHPDRGLVSPDDFIPLAEESGLIVEIGAWALRTACNEAARWPDDIKVAVNLSPVQFKRKGLVNAVIDALASSGLVPGRLELEITESILITDTKATLETLNQMRNLGIRISMDDFGTGYSSLSYLRQFPFDKIKLDRSFVRDITTHAEAAAIVRVVASLGSTLNIITTAEGVETREQFALLQSDGYTEAQGYLFSKPRPHQEIPALIERLNAGMPPHVAQGAQPEILTVA